MSEIIKFRVLSDEDDNFLRDYQIPGDMTLRQMHDFVCADLGYDNRELCSFFLSDDKWGKLYEFTSVDMGMAESDDPSATPMTMDGITVGRLVVAPGDRLLYIFDQLEDRALFFEAIDMHSPEEGLSYPRVQLANGQAPDQYDAAKSHGSNSIFEEAMGDYNDFEGDDYFSDDE
ncbi:MAG: hypothetical protein OSJ22_01855 [Rikenellaceae bacterium]|nr:hypothetical protein [Rikenellaceae bacterium]